jgi:hypothetical protein
LVDFRAPTEEEEEVRERERSFGANPEGGERERKGSLALYVCLFLSSVSSPECPEPEDKTAHSLIPDVAQWFLFIF